MADRTALDFSDLSFTDPARQVFALAKEHVVRLRHEAVGVEHVLLGLLDIPGGAAAAALDSAHVDRNAVQVQLEMMHPVGVAAPDRGELPYAATGVELLRRAMAEARSSKSNHVTTGLLLLAAVTGSGASPSDALRETGASISDLVSAVRANPHEH